MTREEIEALAANVVVERVDALYRPELTAKFWAEEKRKRKQKRGRPNKLEKLESERIVAEKVQRELDVKTAYFKNVIFKEVRRLFSRNFKAISEQSHRKALETLIDLERERLRETAAEADRNRRFFEAGKGKDLVHIDSILTEDGDGADAEDSSSSRFVSDGGKGADFIHNSEEFVRELAQKVQEVQNSKSPYEQKKEEVVAFLSKNYAHLVKVFDLVCINGANRQRSIECLACELLKKRIKRQSVNTGGASTN